MTNEQSYTVTFIGFVAAFVALVVLIFVVGGPWGHRGEGVLVASVFWMFWGFLLKPPEGG